MTHKIITFQKEIVILINQQIQTFRRSNFIDNQKQQIVNQERLNQN
jgi:hypothetical protein